MNRFLRFVLPFATAVAAFGVLAPGVAMAGTYTVTSATSSDVSGWESTHADGFAGCSRLSYPGVCAASDVGRPTPLRIFGSGAVIGGGVGLWSWYAPATTTIVRGSVEVAYKTTAPGTSVYLKARTSSQNFDNLPRHNESTGDGSNTWAVPGNTNVVGLALRSNDKRTYGNKWDNNLQIKQFTIVLSDATAPTVTVSGALTSGQWLNQSQAVCLSATAGDAGAGVARLELDDATGRTLDSYDVAKQSATQPGARSIVRALCAVPASLGEGTHQLKVVARDAAGVVATYPFTVNVDTVAPVAKNMTPADHTTDRRAPVSFAVDAGPSGLSTFSADLDGVAMSITGSEASLTPGADLALGSHTVHWSATDGAGNAAHAQWSFTVADALPKSITGVGPRLIVGGHSARLTFHLVGDAASVASVDVRLQSRVGSAAYGPGRELKTSASGTISVVVRPRRSTVYRLSLVAAPAILATHTVKVVEQLHLASGARNLHLGHKLRLTPWESSRHGHFRVSVQLHTRSGWELVGRLRVNTTLKVKPLARGHYLFRVVGPTAGVVVTQASRIVSVNVI